MQPAAARFEIHQIAYNALTLATVNASGFKLLDNMANERPDWYEYWPIRHYLLNHTLEENVWYGFFSPRFQEKTGLGFEAVAATITAGCERAQHGMPEVFLFSPQPDMGAFFLNVFEQGEMFHPGLMDAAKQVHAAIGMDAPIDTLVMDSRHIVYSNYFVARKPFWQAWFRLTEAIFAMAEDLAHPLSAALCGGTQYRGISQQKVFVVERIASLMLATQPQWRACSANTFAFAWSAFTSLNGKPELAVMSDALKMAFRECGHPQYIAAYNAIRRGIGAGGA